MAEVIFSSSGSTSLTAKKIVRTEESLRADAANLVQSYPQIWGDRSVHVVASVRPEHMYGALWCVRAPQIAGLSVDPEPVLSVEQLVSRAQALKSILFVTSPSFLEKAILHPDFPSLRGLIRHVITSGSPLRAETSHRVYDVLGVSPFEIYGCTEIGSVASRQRIHGESWTLCPNITACAVPEGISVDSPYAERRPFVLSDRVEFTSARTFNLYERLDRRVKILEKYVSLPELEAIIEKHSFVSRVRLESLGGDVPRLGALVVPSAEGLAILAETQSMTEFASRLRRDLLPQMANSVYPRRLRVVHELPVNPQGKTTAVLARAALTDWLTEPIVTSWSAHSDTLEVDWIAPRDAIYFKGHFESFALMPGVAQLALVRYFARQVFTDFPEAGAWRRLKFQNMIRPGDAMHLSLKRLGPSSFDWSISKGDKVYALSRVEGVAE